MILGGTYQIPVVEGLQDENWLDQLKLQDTFNEDSFEREYKKNIVLYKYNELLENPQSFSYYSTNMKYG